MGVPTEDSKRMKRHYKSANFNTMKKVEKVLLTLCYLFTIGASIKIYTKMLMNTPEFTFSAIVDLVFVGFLLSFLSVMAFILLFTKRPND